MRMWLLYPILLTLLAVRLCGGPEAVPPPTAGPMHKILQLGGYHIHSLSPSNCVPYGTPISLTMMIQPQGTITITHLELEITRNSRHDEYRWTDPLTEVNQILPLPLTAGSSPLTITTHWHEENLPQQTDPWYGVFIYLHTTHHNNWGETYQRSLPIGYIGIDRYSYEPYPATGGYISVPCDNYNN